MLMKKNKKKAGPKASQKSKAKGKNMSF